MLYNGEETSVTINSAKQLKINASEIEVGWEGEFGYTSDPVKTFEETCEYLETMKDKLKKNITDDEVFQENLEKDKALFLELSDKLREYGMKLFKHILDLGDLNVNHINIDYTNNVINGTYYLDMDENQKSNATAEINKFLER